VQDIISLLSWRLIQRRNYRNKMAKIFGLSISGIDKVVLSFVMADRRMSAELEKALFREGTKVQVEAVRIIKENRHVVTGTLWRSIRTSVDFEGFRTEVNIGTNVEYAPFVEALPDGGYMFPAYWNKKDEVITGLQKAVLDAINEVKGR